MKKLTDEQLDRLADRLEGTCDTIEKAFEDIFKGEDFSSYDVTEKDFVDVLEKCIACEHWFNFSELVCENGEIGYCDQCRPDWLCETSDCEQTDCDKHKNG